MCRAKAASSYRATLQLEADRQVDPERAVELLAGRWCEGEDFGPIAYEVHLVSVEEGGDEQAGGGRVTSYAERDDLIREAVRDGLSQAEVARIWSITPAPC